MAVLRMNSNKKVKEFQLIEPKKISLDPNKKEDESEITIGAEASNTINLDSKNSVLPQHGVIVRSSGAWVLIDKSNGNISINQSKIMLLQVLEHGDKIRFGEQELEYIEINIQKLAPKSMLIGVLCPFCMQKAKQGDEIILCPRCNTLHHRDCWFGTEKCAKGCGYPTLPVEQLDSYSGLINSVCTCGKIFKRGDFVVHCPECAEPYHRHSDCWQKLAKCEKCDFVRQKSEQK